MSEVQKQKQSWTSSGKVQPLVELFEAEHGFFESPEDSENPLQMECRLFMIIFNYYFCGNSKRKLYGVLIGDFLIQVSFR